MTEFLYFFTKADRVDNLLVTRTSQKSKAKLPYTGL